MVNDQYSDGAIQSRSIYSHNYNCYLFLVCSEIMEGEGTVSELASALHSIHPADRQSMQQAGFNPGSVRQ
jgi:hypothetical protein